MPLLRAIRRFIPHRRRRFWRYVSPRRRGAGFLLLALLGVLLLGYVHLTNDQRIRRQAEQDLQRMTGCRVSIHQAHFSIFGGVRLSGVQLHLPESPSPHPLLRAEEVLIRHRPWMLVTQRRRCSKP